MAKALSLIQNFTKDQLEEIVKNSTSRKEVLRKIGYNPINGNNWRTVKIYIIKYNFDISHFLDGGFSKYRRVSTDDILNNRHLTSSDTTKKRLLKHRIFEHKCQECGLADWRGSKIPIELHHKDGNNHNNRLENLQLLCPNCHALTDTYKGKNRINTIKEEYDTCSICGGKKSKYRRNKKCKKCGYAHGKNNKINWPPKQIVLNLLKELGWRPTSTKLGVSQVAISKFLKRTKI